jgi:hypothetical protein
MGFLEYEGPNIFFAIVHLKCIITRGGNVESFTIDQGGS